MSSSTLPMVSDALETLLGQQDLWTRISGCGRLLDAENEAVKVLDGDPRIPVNYHSIRLGSHALLHSKGKKLLGEVKRDFGFGHWDFWGINSKWLANELRQRYSKTGEEVGWITKTPVRRPPSLRHLQDTDLHMEQEKARIYFLCTEPEMVHRHSILPFPTRGLRFACKESSEAQRRKQSLVMLVVPRRVCHARFGVDYRYKETWFCLGRQGEDDSRLVRGEIPAAPDEAYQGDAFRIRTNPIVNLTRVSRGLWVDNCGIELDPLSGEVLSIRLFRMPLKEALLSGAPVEYQGMHDASSKID